MTNVLAGFSATISKLVASAAPLVCAIRVGQNRHVSGFLCRGDAVVTTERSLPALERYTVLMPNRPAIAARPGARDAGCNLVALHLETARPAASLTIVTPAVGSVALVLGADADASPTVRLTVVQRFVRTADGPAPVLDLARERVDPGSVVLDAEGRLIGLAALGPSADAVVIPGAMIGRMLMPALCVDGDRAPDAASTPLEGGRRAWLGVALQPITVPDPLVALTGQESGRMVVSITKGGPADKAGLRVGDVVLALNGTCTSGPHTLRALLGKDRIGTTVKVRLLRDGGVITTDLTLAAQPGG